ncbi:hypothetical protein HYH02_008198 [Chlamydomonas schloesseri]|uniref:Uncharacterized protein n=1 Tax=Chlamydomonas schloesseri TaxID=2026947 RepID=A0A835WFL0_9CHLO|nr:hypothetical protein HYH02_008198 [Chlamydomonas schloesseri]|eukprot:KAG2446624.1 hypothetical protein HYH02_008198 [Chlamydomonas schloesseri]
MACVKLNICVSAARVCARSSGPKPVCAFSRVGLDEGVKRPVTCAAESGSQLSVAGDADSIASLTKALQQKDAEVQAGVEKYNQARAEAKKLRRIFIEGLVWFVIVVAMSALAGGGPVQSITTAMGLAPAFEFTRIMAKGMSIFIDWLA